MYAWSVLYTSRCNREHVQAIRTKKTNSKYAQHILDTQHRNDSTKNTMTILHVATKVRYMNTLRKFHTHTHKTARNAFRLKIMILTISSMKF
jgi:hypothetical protein